MYKSRLTAFSTSIFVFLFLVFGAQSAFAICAVPRVAAEYVKVQGQLAQCSKNDKLPFCDKAEDYQPVLTTDEAKDVWACLLKEQISQKFDQTAAPANIAHKQWKQFSRWPYQSAHVNRFVDDITAKSIYVMNYSNKKAHGYGLYEKAGILPEGAILAKYSMVVSGKGGVVNMAPVYFMTKKKHGSDPKSHDWFYSMTWPTGSEKLAKELNKDFSQGLCKGCHLAFGKKQDSMLFMPKEVRLK